MTAVALIKENQRGRNATTEYHRLLFIYAFHAFITSHLCEHIYPTRD